MGTPLFHLHTPLPEIVRAIRIVLRRGSLRAAEELTGHNYDTIAGWLRRLGEHAAAVTEVLVRDLALSEVDEFWPFVGKKGGRSPAPGPSDPPAADELGERWGALSVERTSGFVGAWASGPRDQALADALVRATRDRTGGSERITCVADGWEAYETAVKRAYWEREAAPVNPNWAILKPTDCGRLTQAIKHRKGRRLVAVEVQATIGEAAELPAAVYLERLNGSLRDRLGCLTRKTPAFAKAVTTWDARFPLALFAHTWLRPHLALRLPLPQLPRGAATPAARRRWPSPSPTIRGLGRSSWVGRFVVNDKSGHHPETPGEMSEATWDEDLSGASWANTTQAEEEFTRRSNMLSIDVSGKVAVVTGAATGIGAAVAKRLVEAGADVFLHYHTSQTHLQEILEQGQRLGRQVVIASADFASDPGQAARMVNEAIGQLGHVDILVNNAAVTTKGEPFETHRQSLFEEVLAVNVTAAFLASQAAANDMIKRHVPGRIINISSVHSLMAAPGMIAYETSKGAINALTVSSAVALGKYGITVNAVAPGAIWVERYSHLAYFDEQWYTSRIPLGRLGHPDDIAAIVTFLASDGAGYITGETILVDGGMVRRMPLVR